MLMLFCNFIDKVTCAVLVSCCTTKYCHRWCCYRGNTQDAFRRHLGLTSEQAVVMLGRITRDSERNDMHSGLTVVSSCQWSHFLKPCDLHPIQKEKNSPYSVPQRQRGAVQLGYSFTLSLTSALNLGGRFTHGNDPVPIVKEAWWAPRAVQRGSENIAPHRDSIPGLFSPQRVAIPTELFWPTGVQFSVGKHA